MTATEKLNDIAKEHLTPETARNWEGRAIAVMARRDREDLNRIQARYTESALEAVPEQQHFEHAMTAVGLRNVDDREVVFNHFSREFKVACRALRTQEGQNMNGERQFKPGVGPQ